MTWFQGFSQRIAIPYWYSLAENLNTGWPKHFLMWKVAESLGKSKTLSHITVMNQTSGTCVCTWSYKVGTDSRAWKPSWKLRSFIGRDVSLYIYLRLSKAQTLGSNETVFTVKLHPRHCFIISVARERTDWLFTAKSYSRHRLFAVTLISLTSLKCLVNTIHLLISFWVIWSIKICSAT